METPAVNSPPRPGFFRRLFAWRRVRKVLFVLAALITLGALFFAEEDWRGARAWANYKRDMEAKGERFDAARLIPPKVPDAQNFAMTPFLAPIFNLTLEDQGKPKKLIANGGNDLTEEPEVEAKRGTNIAANLPDKVNPPRRFTFQYGLASDLLLWAAAFKGTNSAPAPAESSDPVHAASIVLDNLKTCEPTLAELQAASARPSSRFNIPYEEWESQPVQSALVEHFTIVRGLARILTLHAEAEMVLGRTDQALQDIRLMFRVEDGLKDEPLLLSQLVRNACMAVILQSVGEGLAEQRWSEAQLRVLQDRLQKTDLLGSFVQALYGERDICNNLNFDRGFDYVTITPRGWDRFEQINVNRAFQDMVFARIYLAARVVSPSVNHSIDLDFQEFSKESGFHAIVVQHSLYARMLMPIFSRLPEKIALAQNNVDLAMVACALERYRLAQGEYPVDLNALVPRFAAALPHDIINGQPLKYRRTDEGRFILYSVGWNEKDDGGVVATKGNPPREDTEQGDWVWQYPQLP